MGNELEGEASASLCNTVTLCKVRVRSREHLFHLLICPRSLSAICSHSTFFLNRDIIDMQHCICLRYTIE